MSSQTPRVSVAHLDKFNGSLIRVVGMVTKLGGKKANLLDNGHNVVLNLNIDTHIDPSNAVEIAGKVRPGDGGNMEIDVLHTTNLGPNFDLNAMNAVVDATHRFKEIFYD